MTLALLERLGVREWINGAGYMTRLGGNALPEEVSAVMRAAADIFVDLAELQGAASGVIARHTGAEAGIVTSGAAAALMMGAAACLARLDPARMDKLPQTDGMPDEFIMMHTHRSSYDHAIRASGARIVDIGVNDQQLNAGIRHAETWEIEAAISDRTAGLAFMGTPQNLHELESWARIAERHGLPILVDAAPWLPPVDNLRRFLDAGATLVCFSGGKAIRGPQGSGILCGRKDLVASALLQQMDMNVVAANWSLPPSLMPEGGLPAAPRHGIGRGMKVSKEAIIGLIVALERFVASDHEAEFAEMSAVLNDIASALAGVEGLTLTFRPASTTFRRPALEMRFDGATLGVDAKGVARRLAQATPPVQFTERLIADGILFVDPACLHREHVAPIARAIRTILDQPASRESAFEGRKSMEGVT